MDQAVVAGARAAKHAKLVLQWCSQAVQPWARAGAKPEHLSIQPMLGGLSNVLHKVQVRDVHVKSELASTGGPQSLLVRTFGANPTLVNRAKEQAIFDACDAAGVSPHMYALDTELGLRAEEFLEGSCMTIEQLRDEEYELRMCPLVAQLHTVEVGADVTPSPRCKP